MAVNIPDKLKQVAAQLNSGEGTKATVREFLAWFGAERRGHWIVGDIRKALHELKICTEPDFEEAWIDAQITFAPTPVNAKPTAAETEKAGNVVEAEPAEPRSKSVAELTSRIKIGMLPAANKPPVCVAPDAEISQAITLMLQHDYSQLPVTTGERDVKGVVSWKSLGSRLALGRQCTNVRECMGDHSDIRNDASLFDAIHRIVENEFVLVRDPTRRLVGIVTTADLSLQFAQLGEPFLLLGEIENHVRNLIAGRFTKVELMAVRDPGDPGREIDDANDLTLGECVRLLENPESWEKLGIKIDRKTFCDELNRIRCIRNDIMHFDPDGVAPERMEAVRKFARFLSDLASKLD